MSQIKSAEEGVTFALDAIRGFNDGTGEFKDIKAVLMIAEHALQLAQVKFNSIKMTKALEENPDLLKQLSLCELRETLDKIKG